MAIAAVDIALWDLKARLLGAAAVDAARRGARRRAGLRQRRVHLLHDERLARAARRLGRRRDPAREDEGRPRAGRDPARLAAREAIGDERELFVDANGAYARKQALALAERFAATRDVSLVRGAGLLRRPRGPAPASATARRPGWRSRPASTATTPATSGGCSTPARSTCLQADVTRCGGITGLPAVAALRTRTRSTVSAHCAPAISHPCVLRASRPARTSSTSTTTSGSSACSSTACSSRRRRAAARPSRPGNGLELKHRDAARFSAQVAEVTR